MQTEQSSTNPEGHKLYAVVPSAETKAVLDMIRDRCEENAKDEDHSKLLRIIPDKLILLNAHINELTAAECDYRYLSEMLLDNYVIQQKLSKEYKALIKSQSYTFTEVVITSAIVSALTMLLSMLV